MGQIWNWLWNFGLTAIRLGVDGRPLLISDPVLSLPSLFPMLPLHFSIRLVTAITLTSCLSWPASAAPRVLAVAPLTLQSPTTQSDRSSTPSARSPWGMMPVSVSPQTLSATPAAGPQSPPTVVSEAVLQEISRVYNLDRSALQVVKTASQTWPDGCLGIVAPDTLCTQALVPGWQITVKAKQQQWVYRTNHNGTVMKLDQTASRLSRQAVRPHRMSWRDLPPALPAGTLFRVISSGGFTGRTHQTLLMNDGRLLQSQVNLDGTATKPQISRVDPQQMRQFQKLVAAAHLEKFHRFTYPATAGSADFITVTLTGRAGTMQYADTVKQQLPDRLKAMIQLWDQMVQN
jgi:hypothetical protein